MADVTAPQFQKDVNKSSEWANGDENTTVTMRLGQQARSPAKVIKDIQNQADDALVEINKSRGYRRVGTFASGFTYELANDVGIDASGDAWVYTDIDELPVIITAGTVPSESEYTPVVLSDAESVSDNKGTNVQAYIDNNLTPFKTVAEMKSASFLALLAEFTRIEWQGYYAQYDGGGNCGVLRFGAHTEDGGSIFSIDANTYIEANLKGKKVNILKFGAIPNNEAIDNNSRISGAVKMGVGFVPKGSFSTSPLRFGRDFDGCGLIGEGIGSELSLISPSGLSEGSPLVHIPKNGGAYGGAFEGAKNFHIDKISLYGGSTVSENDFATTGLVVENSEGFTFGRIWTHGFYKSGMLLTGTCKLLDGDVVVSFDNGNQAGAVTGGQGVAFSLEDSESPQGYINRVIAYDNGLSNFGQGLDWVEGNLHLGTLHAYDNGASSMKIVRAAKARIDNFISESNNKHIGNGFPSLYTNGDFGELHIGYFESDNSYGSGISHSKTGLIIIDTANIKNAGGNAVALQAEASKVSRISIGKLIANNPSVNFINQSGNSHLKIGELELSGCPNQGVVLNGTESRIGITSITDCIGVPLWFRGGDITAVDTKISRADLSGSVGCLVDAAVSNASILNLKTKGYTTPLSDNGTATYKPNSVAI